MNTVSSPRFSGSGSTFRRFPVWVRIAAAVVLVVVVAFAVMMSRINNVPNNQSTTDQNTTEQNTTDQSTTEQNTTGQNTTNLHTTEVVMSEQGHYQVSYVPQRTPIPINQIQTWTIRVTDPNGQPIENAEITVDGGMPSHGHGLPTAPEVREYLGEGLYRVEGMKFNMSGAWEVKFKIVHDGSTDTVTFDLTLLD